MLPTTFCCQILELVSFFVNVFRCGPLFVAPLQYILHRRYTDIIGLEKKYGLNGHKYFGLNKNQIILLQMVIGKILVSMLLQGESKIK